MLLYASLFKSSFHYCILATVSLQFPVYICCKGFYKGHLAMK